MLGWRGQWGPRPGSEATPVRLLSYDKSGTLGPFFFCDENVSVQSNWPQPGEHTNLPFVRNTAQNAPE